MVDKNAKTTGREEDYRDYEERDVNDGWPYADGTGAPAKVGNGSYGDAPENFDESENPGFQTSGETAIDSADGPDLFGDDTHSDTDDDALEDAIGTALSDSDIDVSDVELKVRRGTVRLTGDVDTDEERRRIEAYIYEIAGISKVRNALTLRSVDGNMPEDWNE